MLDSGLWLDFRGCFLTIRLGAFLQCPYLASGMDDLSLPPGRNLRLNARDKPNTSNRQTFRSAWFALQLIPGNPLGKANRPYVRTDDLYSQTGAKKRAIDPKRPSILHILLFTRHLLR